MRGEGGEARAGEGGSGSQSVETSSIVNAFGCESRRKSEGYSLRLFTNFAYFFSDFLAFIASLCLFNLLCCTFPSPSSIFQCILFTFTCHLPHTCIQSSSISHQSLHIIAGSSSLCIWTNIVLYVSCLLCICLLVYRLHPLRLFFLHASLWLSFFLLFPLADSLSSGWAPVHDVCFMSLLGLSLFSP